MSVQVEDSLFGRNGSEIFYVKGHIAISIANVISIIDTDHTFKKFEMNYLIVEGGHSRKIWKLTGSQYHFMTMILTDITFYNNKDQAMTEFFCSPDSEVIYLLMVGDSLSLLQMWR